MRCSRIPTLDKYTDWLDKSKYELSSYKQTSSVYDLANCFLSLNALPEWIINSDDSSEQIKDMAKDKLKIMKSLELNTKKVKDYDLDQLLRLIRLFCNHAKHADPKNGFKRIRLYDTFPLSFPIKFEYLTIGNNEDDGVKSIVLLEKVIQYWDKVLTSSTAEAVEPSLD